MIGERLQLQFRLGDRPSSFCIFQQVRSSNVTNVLKQANLVIWNSPFPREMRSCAYPLSNLYPPPIHIIPLGKPCACRVTPWLEYLCKSSRDLAFYLSFKHRERTVTATSVPANSRLAGNRQPDARRNLYVLGLPFDLVKYVSFVM